MRIYDDAMRVGHRVRARLRAVSPGGYHDFEGHWCPMDPGWEMELYDTKTDEIIFKVDHSYWTNLSIAHEEASLMVAAYRVAGYAGLPKSKYKHLDFERL